MKRIQYIFIMALMLTLGMGHSWAIGGSGTSSSPYEISSASDWDAFRTAVNNRSNASTQIYAKLTGSFTISSGAYTPVGTSSKPFYGEFNGQGYTITLTNAQGSSSEFGLFGYVSNATIINLTVAGTMTVTGEKSHIGGIVAYLQNSSTIKGCTFTGTLNAGSSHDCIGGIVGFAASNFSGTIKHCFCNGTIKTTSTDGGRYIGGILGYFNDEQSKRPAIRFNFSDCQFMNGSSNMTSGAYINGIIGRIRAHADYVQSNTCIANGNVTRAFQSGNTDATIENSNKVITISVTAGSNGRVSKSYVKPTSTTETMIQVTATPNDHYHFSSWSDNEDQTHLRVLTSDVNISANFAIDRHSITLAKYGNYDYRCRLYVNGTESTGGTYDYGTQLTLKCVPDAYCYFVDWKKGSTTVSSTAQFTYTVTGDATLTATCYKTIYTLTLQTNDANRGTVSGSSTASGPSWQGSCDAYNDVSLTATANTGYHFVNWTKDGQVVSTSASCSYRAHGNETLVANFAPNPYTLTLGHTEGQTDSWGTISASGTGVTLNQNGTYTVPYTTTVTLTATAASNHYKFKQWSDGNTQTTRTYTMPAENTSITAEFEYVFTIANGTLTACKDWASGAYTIPSGVTAIGQQAFNSRSNVTAVTIPASVTSIGYGAFNSCSSLSSVTFEANSHLTTIGYAAFSGCHMAAITIPASVTSIECSAFNSCTSLSSVTFEANSHLTTIGCQSFWNCHLAAITIPASVTTIETQAFNSCSSLQDVTFLSNTPPFIYVSNDFTPFTGCHSNLKIHLTCQQIANYTNTSTYANATNWTDTRLTSRFAPDMSHLSSVQYAVASGQSDMGSVSASQSVTNCSDPYLTASPSAHYHFVKWSTADNDNFSTSATLTVGEVAANTTYTAHFAIDTYTLTVGHTEGQSDSWGTISVSGTGITNNQDGTWTVPYGTQIRLIATTADDHYYRFNKWSDGNSSSSHYYTMPAQDVNLTGEFHYAFVIEDGTGANGVATHTITGIRNWASGAYEIPATVTAIGDSAFINNRYITSITFAEGSQLATIGTRAFKWSHLTSITIPPSVTSIGEEAFSLCSSLSTVTFAPRTAQQTLTLGSNAFYQCALTSITIPASVTSIGSGAFSGCRSLGTITFEEGSLLTTLASSVFSSCGTADGHHLTTVTLPTGITSIGSFAFNSCSYLSSLTIPAGVTSIGNNAFNSCTSLSSVTIPAGVTSISNYTFNSCSSLSSVTIPAGVTYIGHYAFQNCTSLQHVYMLPATPPYLATDGFTNCHSDLQFHLSCRQLPLYSSASEWRDYSSLFLLDLSYLSRVQYAVADGCSGMGSVSTSENVSSCSDIYLTATANEHYHFVKWSTANNTNYSTSATLTANDVAGGTTYTAHFAIDTYTLTVGHAEGQSDSWGTFSVSGTGITDNHNGTWTVPYGTEVTLTANTPTTNSNYYHFTQWSDGNTQTSRTITMPANNVSITAEFEYVFVISNGTLTACKSWASGAYTIPAGVTTIGNSAFESRGNITALTIPASVSSIEAYAFWNCSGLSTVTFAANSQLTTIGDFAFAHSYDHSVCPLSEIVIPALVTTIGNSAFYDCRYLSSVTFEANSHLTTISAQAFWSCSFGSITIPTSVTTIENQAFSYCSNLQHVYMQPATPPSINVLTFDDCHNDLKIHLSCQQVANYTNTTTYANATNWTDRRISDLLAPDLSHLSSVQYAVANGCSGMGSVSVGQNLTTCSDTYLTATANEHYHFVKWSTASNSNVSSNTTLTAGEVTANTTYMANFALDTYTLTVAHADGQTDSWGTFSVSGTGITDNHDGTWTVPYGTQVTLTANTPTNNSNYYHFKKWSDDNTQTSRTITMPAQSVSITAEFEYVFTIVDNVLTDCKGWASGAYEIPASVTAIGNGAFQHGYTHISQITAITFEQGSLLTTIGKYAFYECSNLESITLPSNLTTIEQEAFYACQNLESITLPNTLTTIGNGAFLNCGRQSAHPFTSITIPASVTSIGSRAFNNCSNLQHVYMQPATPPSLTVSESFTPFSGCPSNLQIHLSCPQVANYTNTSTYANATNWTDRRISDLLDPDLTHLSSVRGNTWSDESEWGTVTTNNNVTSCSDIYLTATANEHYHFVKWSTASNSNVSSNTTLTAGEVTANTTYMANFAPDTYTLTVTHADGQTDSWGTLTVSGTGITDNHDGTWTVPYGTQVTLTANTPTTASNYYHFTQWSDGNTQTSRTITMPAQSVSITAEFEYVFTIVDGENNTRTLTACKSWAEGAYEIPYGVTAIGNNAFYGRENITSINITATVNSIGSEAFRACNRLSTISFADDSQLRSIGTSAFMYCGTIYPLTSVTIPESVTSIGSAAFDECSNLKHVYMQPTTPPSINTNTFGNCHSELKFHIPCQQMANYTNTTTYPNASNWSSYSNRFTPDLRHINDWDRDHLEDFIDITAEGLGTVNSNYIFIENCDSYFCTVDAVDNYHFVNWTDAHGDVVSTNATLYVRDVTPDGIPYTPHFAINTYTLTVAHAAGQTDDWGTISVSGNNVTSNGNDANGNPTYTVPYGTRVTLTTTTSNYYRFKEWSRSSDYVNVDENGEDDEGHASLKFNMPAEDMSFTAEFEYVFTIVDGENNTRTLTECKDWVSGAYEIPSGVTAIGDQAFIGRISITAISIPASVTSIGSYAFYDCNHLGTITFSDDSQLTTIGESAFRGCFLASSITIPGSVTSIGNGAFGGCTNLGSITFNNGSLPLSIGEDAFGECGLSEGHHLTAVTIPARVTAIGNKAFYYCYYINSINFEETSHLTSIGELAFYQCGSQGNQHLTSITIPASVTSIGNGAFYGCSYLQSVTLQPATPPAIDEEAFDHCHSGLQLHLTCDQVANYTNTATYPNASGWSSYSTRFHTDLSYLSNVQHAVADGQSSMGYVNCNYGPSSCSVPFLTASAEDNYHFVNWTDAQGNVLSTSNPLTAGEARANTTYYAHFTLDTYTLTVAHADGQDNNWGTVSVSVSANGTTLTPSSTDANGNTTYAVPYNTRVTLTATGSNNYYNWKSWSTGNLTNETNIFVTENRTVTVEFEYVFTIENNVLTQCKRWASGAYEIPSGVTAIDDDAFDRRGNITAITIPASVTTIGNSAFNGCSQLGSITFATGSQLATIGNNAFRSCGTAEGHHLTAVTIPATVTSLGEFAFSQSSYLATVTFATRTAQQTLTMGTYTFYQCYELRSINLPSTLTAINGNAFRECTQLSSITIPASVTSIGSSAFYGCSNLQDVYLQRTTPPHVEGSSFASCHSDIQFHLTCAQIANYTDANNDNNAYNWNRYYSSQFAPILNLPTGVIAQVATDCQGMGSASVNADLNTCDGAYLTAIANTGYRFVKWSTATNDNFSTSATLTANEVTANTTYTAHFALDAYTLTVAHAAGQSNSWGTVSVSANGTTLTSSGNDDNGNPTYTVAPGTEVTLTATSASNYYKWKSWSTGDRTNVANKVVNGNSTITVEFEYVFTIADGTDENNNATRTLTACKRWASGAYEIPSGVTAIGNDAFYDMDNITAITIPASVTSIGSDAFASSNSLGSITFAQGSQLVTIGGYAFQNCNITAITIPASVTSIGGGAFCGNTHLSNVTFAPRTAQQSLTMGTYTFYQCYELRSINLPSTLTAINGDAFRECTQLSSITIPASVTSIGSSAFFGCSNLQDVYLQRTTAPALGDFAFSYCHSNLTFHLSCAQYSTYSTANNWSDLSSHFTADELQNGASVQVASSCSQMGSVSIDCATATATATANTGCSFTGWYVEGSETPVSTNATLSASQITANTTYYARFVRVSYTLTVGHASGQDSWGTINVSGTGVTDNHDGTYTVLVGTSVTLTASAAQGYTFYCWFNVDEGIISDREYTINSMSADASYIVQFEREYYTLTVAHAAGQTDYWGTFSVIGDDVIDYGNNTYLVRRNSNVEIQLSPNNTNGLYYLARRVSGAWENQYDITDHINVSFTMPENDMSCTAEFEYVFTIANGALTECKDWASGAYEIPASVTAIGDQVFRSRSRITSITFAQGSQLATIGEEAFKECVFTSITIPASVTSIGVSAFEGCSSLGSITFAEGSQLTSIGNRAFIYCGTNDNHPLTSVTIPASVTSIGNEAFRQCSKLSNITFAEGSQLATIGEKAFYSCGKLTSITIPASVTSIGEGAFNVCNSLGSITFGANSHLTTIGKRAFSNCGVSDDHPYLTAINIPSSVTSIGADAFRSDNYLSTITFGENSQLTTIGACAFYQCGIRWRDGHLLTAITIPASVTSIGDSAFRLCDYLQDVTLQPATPPALGRYAFQRCHSDLRFHVSCAQYSNYSTADNWSNLNFSTDRFPNGASVQVAPGCSLKGTVSVDCATATATATANTSFTFTGWYVEGSQTPVSTNATLSASQMTANTTYYASFVGESHTLTVVVNNAPQSANWGGIRGGSSSFVVRHGDVARIAIEFNENGTLNGADYNFKKYYNVKTYQRSDMEGTTTPTYTDPNYEYQFTMPDQDVTVTVELEYVFTIENSVLTACKVWASGDLVIPDGVVAIGTEAFYGKSNISCITIPASVTSIRRDAFNRCQGLTSITIPASVTSIGNNAFYSCDQLERVNLLPTMPPSLGNTVFDECSDNIHFYIPCTNRGNYDNAWSYYQIGIFNPGRGQFEYSDLMDRAQLLVEVQGSVASACQGMGTVSVNNQITDCWEIVLSATANTGYHFLFWNDGNTNDERSAYETPATGTLTAYFEPDNFYLYAHVADEQQTMGHVSGSGTYAFGTEAILTAEAYEGYAFERWSDGSTDNPRTVTIGLENDYTAFFREAAGTTTSDIRIVSQGSSLVIYGGEGQQLRLYDMQGRLLSSQTIASTPFEMHDLATGVYMVQVGDQPAQKVVIMK